MKNVVILTMLLFFIALPSYAIYTPPDPSTQEDASSDYYEYDADGNLTQRTHRVYYKDGTVTTTVVGPDGKIKSRTLHEPSGVYGQGTVTGGEIIISGEGTLREDFEKKNIKTESIPQVTQDDFKIETGLKKVKQQETVGQKLSDSVKKSSKEKAEETARKLADTTMGASKPPEPKGKGGQVIEVSGQTPKGVQPPSVKPGRN